MDNENIEIYLKRNPYVRKMPLIRDVAEGLEYMHSRGIVHGDMKGVSAQGRVSVSVGADLGLQGNVLINKDGRGRDATR